MARTANPAPQHYIHSVTTSPIPEGEKRNVRIIVEDIDGVITDDRNERGHDPKNHYRTIAKEALEAKGLYPQLLPRGGMTWSSKLGHFVTNLESVTEDVTIRFASVPVEAFEDDAADDEVEDLNYSPPEDVEADDEIEEVSPTVEDIADESEDEELELSGS